MTAESFERLMIAVVRDLMPAPSGGRRQGEDVPKLVPLAVAGLESEAPRALGVPPALLATAATPAVLRKQCEMTATEP